MISLGIYTKNKLFLRGLELLLRSVEDFEILYTTDNKDILIEKIKLKNIHVLVFSIDDMSVRTCNYISKLNILHPKLKILLLSNHKDESTILKAVKSNAKGLLAYDATPQDITEAVYSLRNGFDYFNESIKHIVLNQYVARMNSDTAEKNELEKLSERQIEILKLWGQSHTNQEIADNLCISIRTVETHKNHIMQKLALKTTIDLVKFSIKNNIISLQE